MSVPHWRRRTGFATCLAIGCALVSLTCLGKPRITGATLRVGGSPRIASESWAYFIYRLENPDDAPATLRLSLMSARDTRSVFEKTVTLGARSQMNGRELVTVAASDDYTLSLFSGDDRLERTSLPARHSDPVNRTQFFFINDDPEFGGSGDLAQTDLLSERVTVSNLGARVAPHHWAGYGDTRVVVLHQPDFAAMTAMQFAALDEYVHRGGTLLFIDPQGVLDASRTPLSDLLPVTPLRVRRVEELAPLDAWGEAFRSRLTRPQAAARSRLAAEEGFAFLESNPRGTGVTTLADGEYPVIRWARRGLGRVGVIAIGPLLPAMRSSYCMYPVWDHVLAWSQAPFSFRYHENSRILPEVLSHLTGFRIPGVGPISRVLGLYLSLLCVLLIGGFALRRHVLAWILGAVLGVVFTCGIFVAAFRQSADRAASSATVVDFCMVSAERVSGQAAVSLFAKSDVHPHVADSSPEGLLRPLPSAARGKRKTPLTAPLLVHSDGESVSAPLLRVQALKPRSFGTLYTQPGVTCPPDARLVLGEGGCGFADALLPDWVRAPDSRVFLLSENGLRNVVVRDGVCVRPVASGEGMRFDTFVSQLAEMLRSGRFPSPSLVVLNRWDEQRHSLSLTIPDFAAHGYAAFFLPLQVEVPPGPLVIPAESIRLEGCGAFGRMYLNEEGWRETIARQPSQVIPIDAILPPYVADLALDTLDITLDTSNPGGNLSFAVGVGEVGDEVTTQDILTQSETLWSTAIKPVAVEGTVHRFRGMAAHGVMEPVAGRVRLLVRVSQNRLLRDTTEAERANNWSMIDFRVQAGGRLPTDSQARRF